MIHTSSSYSTLLISEPKPNLILCCFNQPQTRNALTQEMVDEIRRLLEELVKRPQLGGLIFHGAGGQAFVSGANISQLRDRQQADALARINSSLFREIELFPFPTIAAIEGYALGGGCELAMACDIRIAGTKAKLGQPEVSLGIIPGAGATYRLPRLVGPGIAKELIFTGRIINSETALEIGLINRIVDDSQVVTTAIELAEEIGKNSALAVRFAKLALNMANDGNTDGCMALESTAQAILFDDEEKRQRMTDFLERRKRK